MSQNFPKTLPPSGKISCERQWALISLIMRDSFKTSFKTSLKRKLVEDLNFCRDPNKNIFLNVDLLV